MPETFASEEMTDKEDVLIDGKHLEKEKQRQDDPRTYSCGTTSENHMNKLYRLPLEQQQQKPQWTTSSGLDLRCRSNTIQAGNS